MKLKSFFVVLVCSTLFAQANKFFANLFEGDIAIRDEAQDDGNAQDAFIRHSSRKWNYNLVPYYIDENSIR